MKQSRLVWEFMLTVIGEKYRLRDLSFGKIDLNTFFMRLQAQDTEIRTYEEKIHHIADQMISIDLDDGVKKNYAIF